MRLPGEGMSLPGEGARLPGEGTRLPGEGTRLPGEEKPAEGTLASRPGSRPSRPSRRPRSRTEAARSGRQPAGVGARIAGSTCGEGKLGNSASYRGQKQSAAPRRRGEWRTAICPARAGKARMPKAPLPRWRVAALPDPPAIASGASQRLRAGRGGPGGHWRPCGLASGPYAARGRSAAEFPAAAPVDRRGRGDPGRAGGLLPRGIGAKRKSGSAATPDGRWSAGAELLCFPDPSNSSAFMATAGVTCRRSPETTPSWRWNSGAHAAGKPASIPSSAAAKCTCSPAPRPSRDFSRSRPLRGRRAASRRTKRGKLEVAAARGRKGLPPSSHALAPVSQLDPDHCVLH